VHAVTGQYQANPDGDPYGAIAEWYDVEHDVLTDDVEWLSEVIGGLGVARPRVLEIGAGTGRIAAGLAAAGCEVTAVEPSEAMRARAVNRLSALPEAVARRVHMAAGSATSLGVAPEARFDAAVFGLGTFAHLATPDERLRALTLVRGHLRPGGLLCIDLDLAGLRRLAETPGQLWHQGTWPLPGAAPRALTHLVSAGPRGEPGLVSLTHFYDVAEQGGEVARTISQMTLALLSRGEVELSLAHCGYRIEAVSSGYGQESYEEGAGHALFVATPA
jgi:SAM-dependent methyltransferase